MLGRPISIERSPQELMSRWVRCAIGSGWSGGQGTDFFVDPDGTIAVLLTQVELGERTWPLLEEFQALRQPSR